MVKEIRWAHEREAVVLMHSGAHIKSCINRKLVEQLKPKYTRYMDKITAAIKDEPDTATEHAFKKAASMVCALYLVEGGSDAMWLKHLAMEAAETLQTIEKLQTIERNMIENAVYVISYDQAAEYGV